MRLTLAAAAALCTILSAGAARAADGPWLWQDPATMREAQPMAPTELAGHVGGWVYAADGSVVGSLDAVTGGNDAVVHVSMFYMDGRKFVVIPAKDLVSMNGRIYVHGTDFAHVQKTDHAG